LMAPNSGNATVGSSKFESLDAQLVKRFSNGISFKVIYEFSKLSEASSYLNPGDTVLEGRISPFDHTHHFVTALSYDLPVGRGKLLNVSNRWLNGIAGGWKVNNIYTYQTGAPVDLSSDVLLTGQAITIDPRSTTTAAINQAAFDLTDKVANHLRTLPRTLSWVRSDAINNFDTSLMKNFNFNERTYLQLRAEAFNLLNRAQFSAPSTSFGGSFGTISSMGNSPRVMQFGARLVF
jgi:hypothetical protein